MGRGSTFSSINYTMILIIIAACIGLYVPMPVVRLTVACHCHDCGGRGKPGL